MKLVTVVKDDEEKIIKREAEKQSESVSTYMRKAGLQRAGVIRK